MSALFRISSDADLTVTSELDNGERDITVIRPGNRVGKGFGHVAEILHLHRPRHRYPVLSSLLSTCVILSACLAGM